MHNLCVFALYPPLLKNSAGDEADILHEAQGNAHLISKDGLGGKHN